MVTSKQLLPVYDKPMIYYPLSTLMLAGIQDILIISTPTDTAALSRRCWVTAASTACICSTRCSPSPDGLAQAFILGEEFIGDDCCAMVLGDNIFYGAGFSKRLKNAAANAANGRSTVFGYYVNDPERFGVVAFDKDGHATDIEEKPARPQEQLRGHGPVLLQQRRCQNGQAGQAQRPRRAGDHDAEPDVSRPGQAGRPAAGPRLRLARHRHDGLPRRGG